MSNNLRVNQERDWKEIEERIAKEARCFDDFRACYQNLTDDIQRSEIITNSVEGVTASAQVAIVKAQALIYDNELKLANEKNKVEELEAAKSRP